MLAANLKPNEIFLAKYEMNSIKTSKGNKGKGQPAGTKREKKTEGRHGQSQKGRGKGRKHVVRRKGERKKKNFTSK